MAFTQHKKQIKTLEELYHTQTNSPPPPYAMSGQLGHGIISNPSAYYFEESDDEESRKLSSVTISIENPIHITGDNNLLSIDPGLSGSKMALSIIAGLKQMSGASGGVPMIDEDGHPRPIRIEVKAETKIEGSKNVIGDRAVFSSMMAAASAKKKQDEERDISRKRGRAGSVALEADSKRAKTE